MGKGREDMGGVKGGWAFETLGKGVLPQGV